MAAQAEVTAKVALEEHFVTPELARQGLVVNPGFPADFWQAIIDRLVDVEIRIREMDRHNVELAILSLASDGIQAQLDRVRAIELAAEANEELATIVRSGAGRFAGFAALAMQDPQAATAELTRCVTELGFKGALVNGFSNLSDPTYAVYYDAEQYEPFWTEAERLQVPIYLHPRNPVEGQRRIYSGRPDLLGPAWAFGVETATHALRLITSGLFDRHPQLTVILGHLGEMLPFAIRRLEARMGTVSGIAIERSPVQCLHENFYITTSGNYHTPSLIGVLLEMGSDRVLFSADYPFEDLADGATWFDALPISVDDRRKIGRDNARRLLRI